MGFIKGGERNMKYVLIKTIIESVAVLSLLCVVMIFLCSL